MGILFVFTFQKWQKFFLFDIFETNLAIFWCEKNSKEANHTVKLGIILDAKLQMEKILKKLLKNICLTSFE